MLSTKNIGDGEAIFNISRQSTIICNISMAL